MSTLFYNLQVSFSNHEIVFMVGGNVSIGNKFLKRETCNVYPLGVVTGITYGKYWF